MKACPILAATLTLLAPPLAAQIDYRNLDDGRPTRVEDAYPVERFAFDLVLPYHLERHRGGGMTHAWPLELEYGIIRNAQVALGFPIAAIKNGGDTEWGLAGLRAGVLYNFNTESPRLPAFAVAAEMQLPVGTLGPGDPTATLRAIATRSYGRNRLHLNAGFTPGPDVTPAVVEHPGRWWVGVAGDWTLYRSSTLLVAEVYVEQGAAGVPVEVNGTFGFRWQWSPTRVLDAGISRGLRRGLGPEFGLTVGLSSAFGIPGLIPQQ